MAEWLKATDCKSVHASVRWFESTPAQIKKKKIVYLSSFFYLKVVGRETPFGGSADFRTDVSPDSEEIEQTRTIRFYCETFRAWRKSKRNPPLPTILFSLLKIKKYAKKKRIHCIIV